ncbi:FtsK/SpoIIIE domain-containing protein [Georgenia halophila]|uniref:FtsK/SpoIIIE domain-containing protein n=1 Tax=Georgenia halophila TaxID=620889 RepID=UPI0031ECB61E
MPAPPEPQQPRPKRDLIRLALPLVACLGMVPLLLAGTASPWRWVILAVPVGLVVAVLAGRRSSPPAELPDPATVLLLAATRALPPRPGATLRARLTATPRRCRSPDLLDLVDGDRIAFIGPPEDVAATVRWVVAQLATCHRLALELPAPWPCLPREDVTWRVVVHAEPLRGEAAGPAPARSTPNASGRETCEVHLVLAGSIEQVPTWCTRVVPVPADGVGRSWAALVAELLAPAGETAPQSLPTDVQLRELLGGASEVGREWSGGRDGLCAPIGVDSDGPVELDLVEHGPHALLAGTTGAGKSEILLAWLVALAVRYSPADLQLVLVDYKGGATFAGLTELPHVAGVLTDLDPAATSRALSSLRAEVRRREALLARAGVKDLVSYRATRPHEELPRLLVVVDEFRALADSHPDVLGSLVRLATQGRSLGVHLILATQRPGGSVTSEVRANLTVRICLRVLEPAESHDVVGSSEAAELPAVPGRAVLRTDRLRTVQAPWCGTGRWVEEVVQETRRGWRARAGGQAPPRPWAPPLPERVGLTEVVEMATEEAADARSTRTGTIRTADVPGLVLARTDLPQQQRLGTWIWDRTDLLVVGGPGTGHTEALRTVVAAALGAGVTVHVVAADARRFADLRGPSLGTVVGGDDPRRIARLLEILTGPAVLVVDDAETVVEQLDLVAGAGQGTALLSRAVRDGRRAGVSAVLSGPASLVGARWLESVRTRLVLAPRDESEALVAGVPRDLLGGPPIPGRGVLLEPGGATALQMALCGPLDVGTPGPDVPRVAALPDHVTLDADLLGNLGREPWPALGRGGDDGSAVHVSCEPGEVVLVVGPSGSGRTTALQTLRSQLTGGGRDVVSPDPGEPVPDGAGVVVLDDLDRWPPNHLDELAAALAGRRDLTVLAAARSESVAAAYRGPLALWRPRATLLILRPAHAFTAQLTDVNLRSVVDPVRPYQPGLGVVVRRGRAMPVQVARARTAQRTADVERVVEA